MSDHGGAVLSLNDLLQSDRVHRSVYTDPALFELEMQHLFGASWVYLAHASQVPSPGCFLATRIGREPVLLVRHTDGTLRAVLNRCAHKGMQLYPEGEAGCKRVLRCGYHGWLYDTDGALRTIPAERGYDGTAVCKSADITRLQPISAVAEYRGFIFGRLRAQGPSLKEWLGPMTTSLDNLVDRSPEGRIEVAGGVFRHVHDANWKFFLENSVDALHPMVVHQSVAGPARKITAEYRDAGQPLPFELQMAAPFGASYTFFDDMGQRATPFGHGDLGNTSSLHSGYDSIPAYAAVMRARYGDAEAGRILALNRNNSVLYPSLMFKAPISLLRIVKPLAVDKTLIETWHFRLCGAPEELLQRNLRYSSITFSPAGPVAADDHEAYRRLQSGLQAQGAEWVLIARHPDAAQTGAGAVREGPGTSDLVYRNQYAAWRDYLKGVNP